jgi:hypothetical protein
MKILLMAALHNIVGSALRQFFALYFDEKLLRTSLLPNYAGLPYVYRRFKTTFAGSILHLTAGIQV